MSTELQTATGATLTAAARRAGLVVLAAEAGTDFHQQPTARLTLALTPDAPAEKQLHIEVSEGFDFKNGQLAEEMVEHLAHAAKRLQNPRPDVYVTSTGLPIRYSGFAWPFHRSTSGADTYIVHGTINLEDGQNTHLHAKVSASMTVTFAEIVPAPEQPYAESFIYNAIRKTLDYGQLELLKSGNRQPVPVTTRYYSRWEKKFVFTDTDDAARLDLLALKAFWLSGALGAGQPVWLADPRDAQYMNTTPAELTRMVAELARQGLVTPSVELGPEFASSTPALMAKSDEYVARLLKALEDIKPSFNESMRGGHTNM